MTKYFAETSTNNLFVFLFILNLKIKIIENFDLLNSFQFSLQIKEWITLPNVGFSQHLEGWFWCLSGSSNWHPYLRVQIVKK